jgi:hypothetical protein
MGLEGIFAKRRDRPYRSSRSADWVKLKNPGAGYDANPGMVKQHHEPGPPMTLSNMREPGVL